MNRRCAMARKPPCVIATTTSAAGFRSAGRNFPGKYQPCHAPCWRWARAYRRIWLFFTKQARKLMVDFGAYGVRAVTIPFYATSSSAQVQYMVNDARCAFCLWVSNSSMTPPGVCCPYAPHWSASLFLTAAWRAMRLTICHFTSTSFWPWLTRPTSRGGQAHGRGAL